tara:strand:+ start:887 stop:1369 length:483 start_codon:yes stop_codon:yes gene_type:complete
MARTFLNNNINNIVGGAEVATNPMASAGVISARFPLDGSKSGVPISVGHEAGLTATRVHTCANGAMEEIYLWASNYGGVSTPLTLSFGSTTFSGSHLLQTTVPVQDGLSLIYPGIPCQNGTIIYAKAGISGTINLTGFAMRFSPLVSDNPDAGFYGSNEQ